jgi:hypothetical protein
MTPPKRPPPPLPRTAVVAAAPAGALPAKFERRPAPKLAPHMIETARTALVNGLPLQLVAGLIGIHKRTLQRWLELGQDENCSDPLLAEFALVVEQARAQAALDGVKALKLHALTDWKATVELLRAQDPDTWSPTTRSKIDVTVTPKGPKSLAHLTEAELEERAALEERLAQLDGAGG